MLPDLASDEHVLGDVDGCAFFVDFDMGCGQMW